MENRGPRCVFALRCGEGAGAALVVMTVVEIWGVHEDEDRSGYRVFAADGRALPAWARDCARRAAPSERCLVLLGRLLCDDSLAVTEEIELLCYLRGRQSQPFDESLRAVMGCLYSTGFLQHAKAKYMPMLASLSADAALRTYESQVVTIVDELARTVLGEAPGEAPITTFGGRPCRRRLYV